MVTVSALTSTERFLNSEDPDPDTARLTALRRGPVRGQPEEPGLLDGAMESAQRAIDNPFRIPSWIAKLGGAPGLIASPFLESAADGHDGKLDLQGVLDKSPRLQRFVRYMADVPKGHAVTAEDALVAFAPYTDIRSRLDPSEDTFLRSGAQAGLALATGGVSLPIALAGGVAADAAICEAADINTDDQQRVLGLLKWISNNPQIKLTDGLARLDDMLAIHEELPEPSELPPLPRMAPQQHGQNYGHPSGLPPQAMNRRLAQAHRAARSPSFN